MQKLQIFVYKSRGAFRLGFVRNPAYLVDLGFCQGQGAVIVSPPLVSSDAYETLEVWKKRFECKLAAFWWQVLSRKSRHNPGTIESEFSLNGGERVVEVLTRIKQVLVGRLMPEQRLIKLLRQEGVWPSDISRAIDLGVHCGELKQLPGIASGPWGTKICSRCQSEVSKEVPCRLCGRANCLLCEQCLSMGEHRSCSTLLALTNLQQAPRRGRVELVLDYELTKAQSMAAQQLLEFWQQRQGKALVWAACGAGKTEVTFPLIKQVLSEGYDVLFAIPRQDIVREMAERLKRSFPGMEVAAHYGGQPLFASGRLVVATTHQVLNFYRRFQLAILDEVDAFPYQGNEMLRFGLHRALAVQGQLVEMTATPSFKERYHRVITIPARYHGFPLSEPELIQHNLPPWSEVKSSQLPKVILEPLRCQNRPWLIFAPTIAACTALQRVLVDALGQPVGCCHSKVTNRSQVIQNFREGKLGYLVTTSVLERGVNFPGVGVIVLYADHGVFTVSALVQIAGRVGRTAEQPTGTVLFVGSKKTGPMKKALALIRELNQDARERGLLFNEGLD
ncbi:MAG: DEAD/DEAH box helicase family protein [Firmicutes bacterium]|nr:DEAD/DEAH box helicase family protein [Bacillota bacterium]